MTRLPNEEVTLVLPPGSAQLIAAALHVFGYLTAGDSEDPDTDCTKEAHEVYLETMRQLFGDGWWQSTPRSDAIDQLAEQLERDMLAIVHRNYRRTADGFVKR